MKTTLELADDLMRLYGPVSAAAVRIRDQIPDGAVEPGAVRRRNAAAMQAASLSGEEIATLSKELAAPPAATTAAGAGPDKRQSAGWGRGTADEAGGDHVACSAAPTARLRPIAGTSGPRPPRWRSSTRATDTPAGHPRACMPAGSTVPECRRLEKWSAWSQAWSAPVPQAVGEAICPFADRPHHGCIKSVVAACRDRPLARSAFGKGIRQLHGVNPFCQPSASNR